MRDIVRVLVATSLAAFMIGNMNAIGLSSQRQQSSGHFFFLQRRREWVLLAFVFIVLLLFTFVVLPNNFKSQLAISGQPSPCSQIAVKVAADEFNQIRKPYFPYLLYTLGLWLGVVFPVLVVLLRTLSSDWQKWQERKLRLDKFIPAQSALEAESKYRFFDELLIAFQDYIIGLKEVAEHYVPLVLAVSLGLLYDQLTSSHQTVTTLAIESSKLAVWLILGSVLPVCSAMVAIGYQSAAHKADLALHNLSELLARSSESSELFDQVVSTRSKLMWEQSPLIFVLSVMKSASVSLPLLLAVVIVIRSVAGPTGWLDLVLPKSFIEIVRDIFKP